MVSADFLMQTKLFLDLKNLSNLKHLNHAYNLVSSFSMHTTFLLLGNVIFFLVSNH